MIMIMFEKETRLHVPDWQSAIPILAIRLAVSSMQASLKQFKGIAPFEFQKTLVGNKKK